ncbi:MAG: SUMF1/EgtB/PvdO family nonheme iron enzyme [Desulfobulbaceae bacterium]|nr:SUMF1/EgtB/PvdO family nonheme iron enzyme [Desulfobulbaceae bacterium]
MVVPLKLSPLKTALILLLLLTWLPGRLLAQEKLVVADLAAAPGVPGDLALALSDFLRDELQALGEYEVLSQRDLEAVAKRAALPHNPAACVGPECLAETARVLGSRFLLTGSLAKLGETYLLNLQLLDNGGEQPGVRQRLSESCPGPEGELLAVIRKMAATLVGRPEAAAADKAVFLMGAEGQDAAMALEMVSVPGGCFQMGDPSAAGDQDARPLHAVCLDAFRIGRYEVTQALWQALMGRNPAKFSRGGNYPVESVSWNEIQTFLGKLQQRTGLAYRLPTEAEWEQACRSGGQEEKFCGGDNPDVLAWYGSNSGRSPHPVGSKAANGLGIFDMSGNVFEWVQDWYQDDFYSQSPKDNPTGPEGGKKRVCRGGAWHDTSRAVTATDRFGLAPSERVSGGGFRLGLSGK